RRRRPCRVFGDDVRNLPLGRQRLLRQPDLLALDRRRSRAVAALQDARRRPANRRPRSASRRRGSADPARHRHRSARLTRTRRDRPIREPRRSIARCGRISGRSRARDTRLAARAERAPGAGLHGFERLLLCRSRRSAAERLLSAHRPIVDELYPGREARIMSRPPRFDTARGGEPLASERQRGAALLVGLVLLLVMTILGVSAMSTATLKLAMAGTAQAQ